MLPEVRAAFVVAISKGLGNPELFGPDPYAYIEALGRDDDPNFVVVRALIANGVPPGRLDWVLGKLFEAFQDTGWNKEVLDLILNTEWELPEAPKRRS